MVDQASINTAYNGLVGWKQPANPDYAIVDTNNQLSSSGQYFQDLSALVTIENIKLSQPYINISDAQFNTYLSDLGKRALGKVMNNLFYTDDLIDNMPLFKYANDWTKTITNASDFVGYKITTAKDKRYKAIINNVTMAFNGDGVVKLLLFHTSQLSPVEEQEITITANSETTVALDWQLSYTYGDYYIGYLTDGLAIEAFNRDYEDANVVNRFSVVRFEPIKIVGHNVETLFDVNDVDYEDETYGLNFDISTFKDYTDVVIRNKSRFIQAYILQLTADVLELIKHTVRSNDIERSTIASAAYELDGTLNNPDMPNSVGIMNKLNKEMKGLRELILNDKLTIDTLI